MKKTIRNSTSFSLIFISILFLVVNCSILTANCYSQSITWQRTYDGPQHRGDEAYDICPADGSNFYAVGWTGEPMASVYVIKLNQFGDKLWEKSNIGGYGYSVAPASEDGCIISTGEVLIRYKPDGDTIWLRPFNGWSVTSLRRLSSGSYIGCGEGRQGGTFNGYVIKIDSLGKILFERNYFGAPELNFYGIEEVTDGGYIVCGDKVINNLAFPYIGKLDTAGNILWEKTYVINGFSYFRRVAKTQNGYIFCGNTEVYPANDSSRSFIMKTDNNGDSIITKVYPSTRFEYFDKIVQLGANKYITSVFSYSSYPSGARLQLIDTNLNILRERYLSFSQGYLEIFSMIPAPQSVDGDLLFAGSTGINSNYTDIDVYLCRLDSALNPPPPIGIKSVGNSAPKTFSLSQNFPNPFNPSTKIKFDIPNNAKSKESNVKLIVYDVLGREVAKLYDGNLNSGSYEINWDSSNYPSGVYFYRLVSGSFTETKKMALVK